MNKINSTSGYISNDNFYEERKNLAAAFRWAERSNLHEAVAINERGSVLSRSQPS